MNTKILASLLVIAAVGTVAGSSTLAEFSDTEISEDNVFTAGELNLKLDYIASYNGEQYRTSADELEVNDPGDGEPLLTVENEMPEAPAVDGPVTFFQLNDVKPGDHGEVTVSLHNDDNPALIELNLTKTMDDQGADGRECVEPEKVAQQGKCEMKSDGINSGGNPNDRGDLEDHLGVRAWRDDGDNIYEPCIEKEGERVNVDPHFYKKCTDERTDQGNEEGDSNGANVGERLIYPNGNNVNGKGFTSVDHLTSQNWKIDGDFDPSKDRKSVV